MRKLLSLLGLCLLALVARAQDATPNPINTPTPPPAARKVAPQPFSRGIAVVVAVGADVLPGSEPQLPPANLILRVVDPARLGANAAGAAECVFEAHAWATLSSERVMVRPRRLQCYDAQGRELAGKAVAGFGVDKDARAGIKGSIVWGALAKELMLLGVGSKSSGASRFFSSALSRASFGLTDSVTSAEEGKGPNPEVVRDLRSLDTLLPNLALEPGREFDVVLFGGAP